MYTGGGGVVDEGGGGGNSGCGDDYCDVVYDACSDVIMFLTHRFSTFSFYLLIDDLRRWPHYVQLEAYILVSVCVSLSECSHFVHFNIFTFVAVFILTTRHSSL